MEIGYTAVIRGTVSARTIAIAKGAIVDGDIEVTSGAPMLEFEEKRERQMRPPRAAVREWRQWPAYFVCSRVFAHPSSHHAPSESK